MRDSAKLHTRRVFAVKGMNKMEGRFVENKMISCFYKKSRTSGVASMSNSLSPSSSDHEIGSGRFSISLVAAGVDGCSGSGEFVFFAF